jgi:cyclic pyranopterin phosphate synthase
LERLVDSYGRVARKLRLSVTDRCNFRCSFCMPREPRWLPRSEVLTVEEMARVVRILASMGVTQVRLTGGEPLVWQGLERLIEIVSAIDGIEDISMTTNGFYLKDKAVRLKALGLRGVTVSLHSLKPDRFEEIVGVRNVFERVLEGIRAAKASSLRVKINCVVVRGCNEDELEDFAELARRSGLTVKFIEFMPFDGERLWSPEKVVSGREIVERLSEKYALREKPRASGSTTRYYGFADGSPGEVGVVTSVTEPFCSDCDRVRLKPDGKLVPCLFSPDEYDLKPLLRSGATDSELARLIKEAFYNKFKGVEEFLKHHKIPQHIRPMHTIGG